nr:MAG TPA: hypothetical protein [Caudoviricetes sp.]
MVYNRKINNIFFIAPTLHHLYFKYNKKRGFLTPLILSLIYLLCLLLCFLYLNINGYKHLVS